MKSGAKIDAYGNPNNQNPTKGRKEEDETANTLDETTKKTNESTKDI